MSSTKKWRHRCLGSLLEGLLAGDTITFAKITRMARSTLQVLGLCMEKQVSVHIAKQNMLLDSSMQAKIMVTILELAGEIERKFIRMRTKEALAARKMEG